MSPTTRSTARRETEGQITGRHVLVAALAFFGVIFLVNGVLLWKALATHSGVVADEPYRKGLAYNKRIDAGEVQLALGWSDVVSIDTRDGVAFKLSDREGRPVGGLAVSGMIGRPSTLRHDIKLAFVERTAGVYFAPAAGLEAGTWLVSLDVKPVLHASAKADEAADMPIYRVKRRLWLKP